MDLSMKWLADYVDCDMPIKDFVSALTLSGSKVECFEQEGEDISNVVVGKVVSMERHPDSDHMFITQVDVGEDEPVQIVTGAQNVHEVRMKTQLQNIQFLHRRKLICSLLCPAALKKHVGFTKRMKNLLRI